MDNINIEGFKKQIDEDIKLIKQNFSNNYRYNDNNYVFNHWILDKIYNIDEELISDYIVDKSGDKQIDCFVDMPDEKKLYIIQNKYYSESKLSEKYLSTFLSQPILSLESNQYPNLELQKRFNIANEDEDYEIYFHLYSTEDKFSEDLLKDIKIFNSEKEKYKAEIFSIVDIYNLYYEENKFQNNPQFNYEFTYNENQALELNERSSLLNKNFKNAKYIAAPIIEIYKMYKAAKQQKYYNIFADNIRDYLGKSKINKQIIKTISDDTERKNFFYYNNGITLTCREQKTTIPKDIKIKQTGTTDRTIKLSNPQIINGCQTVNAIFDVIDADTEINDCNIDNSKYKDAYVLVKILNFKKETNNDDKTLYDKIVEYTNNQNAIKLSDFTSNTKYFQKLHSNLLDRGFFLEIKRSDKNTFNTKNKDDINKLIKQAQKSYPNYVKNKQSIYFSLEKMILIYMAIYKDGYYAYTKKSFILNPENKYYTDYSKNLDRLTTDTLIKMYLFFLKVDNDRRESEDKRTPIPYYVFSLIGYLLKREKEGFEERISEFFNDIFTMNEENFNIIYKNYLCNIIKGYTNKSKNANIDYNKMIKTEINLKYVDESISETCSYREEDSKVANDFFNNLNEKL